MLSIVTIAVLVVVLVGMGRMAWRIWHGNEPMEPGSTAGDQMLGTKNSGAFVRRSRRTRR